jgi:hypothetical protein
MNKVLSSCDNIIKRASSIVECIESIMIDTNNFNLLNNIIYNDLLWETYQKPLQNFVKYEEKICCKEDIQQIVRSKNSNSGILWVEVTQCLYKMKPVIPGYYYILTKDGIIVSNNKSEFHCISRAYKNTLLNYIEFEHLIRYMENDILPSKLWLDSLNSFENDYLRLCMIQDMANIYSDTISTVILSQQVRSHLSKITVNVYRANCLQHLISSDWNKRVWTLQEAALPLRLYLFTPRGLIEIIRPEFGRVTADFLTNNNICAFKIKKYSLDMLSLCNLRGSRFATYDKDYILGVLALCRDYKINSHGLVITDTLIMSTGLSNLKVRHKINYETCCWLPGPGFNSSLTCNHEITKYNIMCGELQLKVEQIKKLCKECTHSILGLQFEKPDTNFFTARHCIESKCNTRNLYYLKGSGEEKHIIFSTFVHDCRCLVYYGELEFKCSGKI